ncbi:MAG: hypothetical protein WAT32_13280, partial [Candidatus Microthrix parvicella]
MSATGSQVLDAALGGGEVSSAEEPATVKLLARLERSGLLIATPPPPSAAAVRGLLDQLTVVVPVYNDATGLNVLLASFLEAERELGMVGPQGRLSTRCVLVDDGSDAPGDVSV